MSGNSGKVHHLSSYNTATSSEPKGGGGGPPNQSMELLEFRVDLAEKRLEAIDDRLGRIENALQDIRLLLVAIPNRGTLSAWNLALIGVILASALALGAILLQSSGNQLAAFQTGLSAVQTVAAMRDQPQSSAPVQPPAPKANR